MPRPIFNMASLSDAQAAGEYEDQMHDHNVRLKEEVKELKEQNVQLSQTLEQVLARLGELERTQGIFAPRSS
jgi:methionine synthase II (cobalamin-independent)